MKNTLFTFLALFIIGTNASAQSLADLYQQRKFKELIEYANSETLTKVECYYIGYAYFQLEEDAKAIKMYDLAIEKGLDEDYIYLYKGLALRYDKQYDKAIKSFQLAIDRNPKRQKNYTELANVYYNKDQYDSALVYFYKARAQEYEHADPYLKIPLIYHIQKKYDKALEEYKKSASLIDRKDAELVVLLKNIGLLEYVEKKNYPNSIKAYTEMLALVPKEYELYNKLIKSYYANEDYNKADSVFQIIKTKYEKKELPEKMMENDALIIDEFMWKKQRVSVMRYYKKPTEFAEPIYQFFIIDKAGKKVERKILTEKTTTDIDGLKHLLCGVDNKTGTHFTYPVGWDTDDIEYKDVKEYALMILNGKLNAQASSNFGIGED